MSNPWINIDLSQIEGHLKIEKIRGHGAESSFKNSSNRMNCVGKKSEQSIEIPFMNVLHFDVLKWIYEFIQKYFVHKMSFFWPFQFNHRSIVGWLLAYNICQYIFKQFYTNWVDLKKRSLWRQGTLSGFQSKWFQTRFVKFLHSKIWNYVGQCDKGVFHTHLLLAINVPGQRSPPHTIRTLWPRPS